MSVPPTERILLVDDSKTTRLLVQAYLVGRAYQFVEASNGKEALAVLDQDEFDLIVCDVFMPDMDGPTFVRRLRADPRSKVRRTPVILASSKRDEGLREECLEAGADVFLNKPLASQAFVTNVLELLSDGHRPRVRVPR
jgi:two-component system chemotaxis response regulator CheY